MKPAAALLALGLATAGLPLAGQQRPRPTAEAPQDPGELWPMEVSRNPEAIELQAALEIAATGGKTPRDENGVERRTNERLRAIRALGRLARRDVIAPLLALVPDGRVSTAAEEALVVTLRAHAPAEGADEQIDSAVNALIPIASAAALGHLPYTHAAQFEAAEFRLREMLNRADGPRAAAARALEALVRRNRRLGRLTSETVALLEKGALWELPYMDRRRDTPIVFESVAALTTAGAATATVVEAALGEDSAEIRRLGALALYGAGAAMDAAARTALLRKALRDRHGSVRYDALRAWVRRETPAHGCGPIADALLDDSPHVALAAIDALGDRCTQGDDAEALTIRLIGEMRTPPNLGSWHREVHALVAIAKRAPARAEIALPMFRQHLTWQVRMYAARAAGVLNDAATLERLAYDDNDNVRDAALPHLRRLKGADSDPAFIAALGRKDYQLLRTAAIELRQAPPSKHLLEPLIAALERVTAERKETSRDIRLALIERIREQGGDDQAPLFERLLVDFDPRIAAAASEALAAITGAVRPPAPRPLPRLTLSGAADGGSQVVARVELDTGRFFEIAFHKGHAPLAHARFAQLVRNKYYDGLTFHRVVPNFVVQGGSPGANEYAGDARYMHDELGFVAHARGTVGISTRGRDTGDAQFFVNLADNRTLDLEYTVFGQVIRPEHLDIVDTIQEGTRIVRISMRPPSR